MTNREFSEQDETFQKACSEVGLPNHINTIRTRTKVEKKPGLESLTRQASKWRNKKGSAYKHFKNNVTIGE